MNTSTKKNKYVIFRDFWDADGKRHPKGKYIELPAEEAIELIEAGSVMTEKAWKEYAEKVKLKLEEQEADKDFSFKGRKTA